MKFSKLAIFIGGFLFGTAGMKILTSRDAKKVYPHIVAAGLRCQSYVMDKFTSLQEAASDILADAKEINEARRKADEPEEVEDAKA